MFNNMQEVSFKLQVSLSDTTMLVAVPLLSIAFFFALSFA